MAYSSLILILFLVAGLGIITIIPVYADSLSFDQSPIIDKHSGIVTLYLTSPSTDSTKNITITPLGGLPTNVTVYGRGTSPFSFYDSHFVEFTSGTHVSSLFVQLPSVPISVTANFQTISGSANVIQTQSNTFPKLAKYTLTQVTTCDGFGGDVDVDGICNSWENQTLVDTNCNHQGNGLCINFPNSAKPYFLACNTTIVDDCPSPDKADVYFEIDSMQGHKPFDQGLNEVKSAFAKSAFVSANGIVGIRFHYQLSDANIPHVDLIPNPGSSRTPGFDQVKLQYYGSNLLTERANADWANSIRPAKMQVFHYVLFGHTQSSTSNPSGSSESPGNDIFITLGTFDGQVGNLDQQEGTLLHETGHNMGLKHGGVDYVNCKPNYVSVMSYTRQFQDIVAGRPLDLSNRTLNNLSETNPSSTPNLDVYSPQETVAFGDNSGSTHYTSTGTSSVPWGPSNTNLSYVSSAGCPNDTMDTLVSYNDWDRTTLQLTPKTDGNWLDGRSTEDSSGNTGAQPDVPTANHDTGRVYQYDELTADDVKNMRIDRWNMICSELPTSSGIHLPIQAVKSICSKIDGIINDIENNNMEQALTDANGLKGSINADGTIPPAAKSHIVSKIDDVIASQSVTVVPEFSTISLLVLAIAIISIIGLSKSNLCFTRLAKI